MNRILTTLLLMLSVSSFAQEIRTYGVKINITDWDKAKDFYCSKLGFEPASDLRHEYLELQTTDNTKLYLHKVPLLLPEGDYETKASFTLQVNHIDSTIHRLKSAGVDFGNELKRKEGVGYAIYLSDPFGKKISFMHQTVGDVKPFKEPVIYNYGFLLPDMDKAREFYASTLGFVERSERYLPTDMPLGHGDKSFAFMLHYREGIEPTRFNLTDNQHIVILFRTTNLEAAISKLKEKGVKFLQKKPVDTPIGKCIAFYDPFGYLSELYEVN